MFVNISSHNRKGVSHRSLIIFRGSWHEKFENPWPRNTVNIKIWMLFAFKYIFILYQCPSTLTMRTGQRLAHGHGSGTLQHHLECKNLMHTLTHTYKIDANNLHTDTYRLRPTVNFLVLQNMNFVILLLYCHGEVIHLIENLGNRKCLISTGYIK